MPILNYTTTIDAFKTVSEIERVLMKHGAKSIMKNYENESITGLSFLIDTGVRQIPVRLPVKVDECLKTLKKAKKENPKKTDKGHEGTSGKGGVENLERLGGSADGVTGY